MTLTGIDRYECVKHGFQVRGHSFLPPDKILNYMSNKEKLLSLYFIPVFIAIKMSPSVSK